MSQPDAADDAGSRDPSGTTAVDAGRRVGFAEVLRRPEFRALWIADNVSAVGTQLSRVSLALLVFDATKSPAATALVYALTFLPTLVGGVLLSGLADRFRRRAVMIVSDLGRALLFAVMALPELSVVVTAVLLVFAVLLESPFRAAQTATLPDVLPGETYETGMALRTISLQASQLAGYAVGGLIAAVWGPRSGLALDAATFVASAVLIVTRVRNRPVPPRERTQKHPAHDYLHGVGQALALIAGAPRLRVLAGLAVLSGFYVVPEGLAAPYAAAIGGGSVSVGLLMAADPAGSALGAWLLVKLLPEGARRRWMAVLSIGPGLVLLGVLGRPGLVISIMLWVGAGVLSVFQIPASVEFVRDLPDNQRGQALGIVISGMLTAQGLGVLAAGLVADATDSVRAIAVFGAAGAACGAALAWRWARVRAADAGPAVDLEAVAPETS